MHDCPCCGMPVYSSNPDEACLHCRVDCDPASTWHCFTGSCDGSGCTYLGECEGYASAQEYLDAQYIREHPELATDRCPDELCPVCLAAETRQHWPDRYDGN